MHLMRFYMFYVGNLVTSTREQEIQSVYRRLPDIIIKNVIRESWHTCLNAFGYPFVICSWSMGCCSNELGHTFRKFSSHSNGCWYLFGKNLHAFERLRLSVQKKCSHSNSWCYLFKWKVLQWFQPLKKLKICRHMYMYIQFPKCKSG